MGAEVLVPIFLFGMPVVAFIIHRVLKHQERIEMIRHGMAPGGPVPRGSQNQAWMPPPPPGQAYDPSAMFEYQNYAAAQQQLRKGIMLSMIGLALSTGLMFIGFDHGNVEFGPWMLGGLIPLFVGIAQVIIAVLSGASFTPQGRPGYRPQPVPPQNAAPGQPSPPRDVTPGPYAYRPGSTTELEPPPPPPDFRR